MFLTANKNLRLPKKQRKQDIKKQLKGIINAIHTLKISLQYGIFLKIFTDTHFTRFLYRIFEHCLTCSVWMCSIFSSSSESLDNALDNPVCSSELPEVRNNLN